jgi:hypothetical protein
VQQIIDAFDNAPAVQIVDNGFSHLPVGNGAIIALISQRRRN